VKKRFLVAIMLLCSLAMFGVSYAYTPASTDTGSLGADQWRVQSDGDIVPVTDSSYDIGETGSEIAVIYADSLVVGGATYTSFAAGTDGNWSDTGTTTTLDQAPTAVIITHATGNIAATGFTAGTGDVVLENAQRIDGGTNNAIVFGDNSDTFTTTFTGNDISLNTSDGGFIFALTDATDGTLDVQTNNDTDDYIQFSTTAHVPAIGTTGSCNLALIPDSGIVAITGGLTTTTTIAATGVITATAGVTLQNGATITEAVDGTTVIGGEATPIVSILATGTSDNDATLQLVSDNGEDSGDTWKIQAEGSAQDLLFINESTTWLTIGDSNGLITTAGDLLVAGTTPLFTIGDGGDEDNTILVDGQGSKDFYVATDNADDTLIVGYGSTVGTDSRIKVNDDADNTTITIGDGAAYDQAIIIDGNAKDYYIAEDYTDGSLQIGSGSTVGTTAMLSFATTGVATFNYDLVIAGTTPLLTVGDGGAEQAAIVIDAAATDFYAGVYNTDGDFYIGTGSTVGTTPALRIADTTLAISTYGDITMTGTTPTLTIGDAGAEDAGIVFDGSATDFYMQIDDTNGDLYIGTGSVAGTTPAIQVNDSTGAVTITGAITHSGAVTNSSTVQNDGAVTFASTLAANGTVTFGDATTDTVTMTGRLIVRTVASTVATAGATGELVFCSGDSKFYGVTVGGDSATFSALN